MKREMTEVARIPSPTTMRALDRETTRLEGLYGNTDAEVTTEDGEIVFRTLTRMVEEDQDPLKASNGEELRTAGLVDGAEDTRDPAATAADAPQDVRIVEDETKKKR